MMKYAVREDGQGYRTDIKYWVEGSMLPRAQKGLWFSYRGHIWTYDLNAAFRYREILATMWSFLVYSVEEYDERGQ